MRKILVAACCAALMGSISIASAQTTGPQGQQTMKSNDNMDANARMMKKKKMKKGMMKSGGMSGGGMSNGGMMDKGGMSK
jgi:pentapeptide MXKDX repeat protein